MILLLGPTNDPMIQAVAEALGDHPYILIQTEDMPNTVRLELTVPGPSGGFRSQHGFLPAGDVRAVYHRVGFSNFEVYQEYSEDEVAYVNYECQCALTGWLNSMPGLVINRPVSSGTNASKPHQIALVEELGLAVPRTLVTNLPETARDFYSFVDENAIYKSISYVRSIVQVMKEEDLARLDTLKNCPIQLQERIQGTDFRVHVVGDRCFTSRILATQSDYRYDKEAEIEAVQLAPELEQKCLHVAQSLGLVLAGIDLRITEEGKAYCFEVNPSPAFSWYQDRTGQPIAQAVAELLLRAQP